MGHFVRFAFDDETSVLMEVSPDPLPPGLRAVGEDGPRGADLPAGTVPIDPVSRAAETLEKSGEALSTALRPLVPVLESVHQTMLEASHRPSEITVELGLKLSSELRLMIVGGGGEASITVSAKWDLRPTPPKPL